MKQREPVISNELANKIADLFEKHSPKKDFIQGPHSTDYNLPEVPDEYDGSRMTYAKWYTGIPEIVEVVKNLPKFWSLDVAAVQSERARAKWERQLMSSVEAIDNAAIRAYCIENFKKRGIREPIASDLTYLGKIAMQDRRYAASSLKDNTGKPVILGPNPYKPEPGCTAKMKLKDAILIMQLQEAYADHAIYAIPVEIAEGSNMEVCRSNLYKFAESLSTANGFAGVGSTWSFTLTETSEGYIVIANCRSSISD